MKPCDKCGSTKYKISTDARGVASAFCDECGAFIKKMSTIEVTEYYESRLQTIAPPQEVVADIDKKEEDKPLCKYCTETWGYRVGRLGHTFRIMDTKFCPMCGRKLLPTDKDY